jgi:hypothetical protein
LEICGRLEKKALESNRMGRTRLETDRLGMIDGDTKYSRSDRTPGESDGREVRND